MEKKIIPLLKVHMPADISNLVTETLLSGQVAEGPKVFEFEKIIGNYIGNRNVIATNSCSGALQLALQLAGVSFSDEVISTPMTCQSTNQPILQAGANIVWGDVQHDTGNLNPKDVKKKITPKTKAIITMHWAGQPGDLSELNSIAKENSLKLIEDAASAFGAEYQNKKIGFHSDFICFSFQAVKHITTGDGGILAVKDKKTRDRAVLMRNHGNDRRARRTEIEWDFDIKEPGWKFHMNDIAATIGIKQMEYHEILLEKRRDNAEHYNNKLNDIPGLKILNQTPDRKSAHWIYTLLVEDRDNFVKMMRENGIQTSIVHQRNDIHSIYKKYETHLPHLDYFYEHMINIPVGWWLNHEDCEYIVSTIKMGW